MDALHVGGADKRKIYRMGRRLDMLKWTAAVMILMISIVFYFIYQFIFSAIVPALVGAPLAIAFLTADGLLIALDFFAVKKYRSQTWYQITADALEHVQGKRTTRYPWNAFSSVFYGRIRPGVLCPVTFVVNGREMILNQYTQSLFSLAADITRSIEPYAEVESGLLERLECMSELL